MNSDEPVEQWERLSTEAVADCRVFEVERWRMRRSAGEADFYVIDGPDWINVVALTDDDDLVLIEQWRHARRHVTLEIPGGMVDPGETPAAAARRELLEETGHAAPDWAYLGAVEPNPAIQTNRCHTFLARGAERIAEPRFDGNEECRTVLRPWADATALVASGEIDHALVIVALTKETLRRLGAVSPIPADDDETGG